MGGRGERRRKGDEAKRYDGVGGSKEDRKEGRKSGWKEYGGTPLNQIPVGPVVLSAASRCPQIRST